MWKVGLALIAAAILGCLAPSHAAGPLPGTNPLTEDGDLAAKMVAGIHTYLDRELRAAPAKRDALWQANAREPLPGKRERLKRILGVVDERLKPHLEYVGGPGKPSRLAETDGCQVHAVRWAVLPGVDAEGLLIEPAGKPVANAVLLGHPGDIFGQKCVPAANAEVAAENFGLRLASRGIRVLVPSLITRDSHLSQNPKLKRATNIPHREFVHRMAFEMGRTLAGYEVQQVLAAADWFEKESPKLKIGVIGSGDGGRAALYAAALDGRFQVCQVNAYFGPREGIAEEPIDRNVWGVLPEFGDAELGGLTGERELIVAPVAGTVAGDYWPRWERPTPPPGMRDSAAPGRLQPIDVKRVTSEADRMGRYGKGVPQWVMQDYGRGPGSVGRFIAVLTGEERPDGKLRREAHEKDVRIDWAAVEKRQFGQIVGHVQKLWRDSDLVRKEFWQKADASTPEAWEKSCDWYRDTFHAEVIGRLPEPTVPLNPRSRQVYDEKDFTGYEVMLDVYEDVFAQGILLLPKGLKPGEKRPVVVCQHGLEGTPRSCIDPEKSPTYFEFARKLVAKGYVVYCPQNPYYGQTAFRQLQRKANPLKLSLFSFIIRQHQRTLDWLETLPNVDKSKIAFYGLSYGGKTAMRVPAVEKRYCLSICSGDFNEWVGKNVSVDLDRSYIWMNEYEMPEFDLGHTFNYAEMAYLIAPRPFMVERGHDDPVGTDDMVASEYAKVRYLYANKLKLPGRTAIDFQPGGHRVFLKGSLEFLERHLGAPKP